MPVLYLDILDAFFFFFFIFFFIEDGPVVYPANAFDSCLRGD